MRRLLVAAAVLAVVAAMAALGWRWWTAPPRESEGTLAEALSIAPGNADGALALAQPARSARWLASHPQALALLKIAAPTADRSLPRLRGFLAALAREARGPVTLWWSGGELAAAATVGPGAARALQELAALEDFALQTRPQPPGAFVVTAATGRTLLAQQGSPPPHLDRLGALAALARLGPKIWWVVAGRSTLELASGNPPPLPQPTTVDTLATGDLAALVAAVSPVGWVPHAPARLLFGGGGWAVALPTTTLSPEIARLLSLGGDFPVGAPAGTHRWRGLLGDLWVRPGPGIAVASGPDLLAQMPSDLAAGESGIVRGPDLARLCGAIAQECQDIPGGGELAAGLRRAAPLLEAVRLARWRLLPEGGHILLEW